MSQDSKPPIIPPPQILSGVGLEDVLVVSGFIGLATGLSILFGLAVACAVCGGILFILGLCLTIYKGIH